VLADRVWPVPHLALSPEGTCDTFGLRGAMARIFADPPTVYLARHHRCGGTLHTNYILEETCLHFAFPFSYRLPV
jgi:hypothetical protein